MFELKSSHITAKHQDYKYRRKPYSCTIAGLHDRMTKALEALEALEAVKGKEEVKGIAGCRMPRTACHFFFYIYYLLKQ